MCVLVQSFTIDLCLLATKIHKRQLVRYFTINVPTHFEKSENNWQYNPSDYKQLKFPKKKIGIFFSKTLQLQMLGIILYTVVLTEPYKKPKQGALSMEYILRINQATKGLLFVALIIAQIIHLILWIVKYLISLPF